MDKLFVKPLGRLVQAIDELLAPLMRFLSGAPSEEPQRTHFWNNKVLGAEEVRCLSPEKMVHCRGIPGETAIWPIFHIPILSGWKNYVVLAPADREGTWYVGWCGKGFAGISRIPILGKVRMLIGPGDVFFFGVATDGHQIKLKEIGVGKIGDGGKYSQIPLL